MTTQLTQYITKNVEITFNDFDEQKHSNFINKKSGTFSLTTNPDGLTIAKLYMGNDKDGFASYLTIEANRILSIKAI